MRACVGLALRKRACSYRSRAEDAYGRDAYGRQARCLSPVAFAVPSALMVPVTTSLRVTGGPLGKK